MNLDEIKDLKLRLRIIAADKAQNHRVPSRPEHKQDSGNEPVAKDERENTDSICRPVRITIRSFRTRLIDGDNLWGKYFVDAIVREAGATVDDSPRWCEVKTEQHLIYQASRERTEIEIEWLDPTPKIPDTSGD